MCKETDNRNENELIIRCSAGCNHFLSFSYEIEDYGEFWVSFVSADYSYWYRIKEALRYIFKGKRMLYETISLTAEDCLKVRNLMEECISKMHNQDNQAADKNAKMKIQRREPTILESDFE